MTNTQKRLLASAGILTLVVGVAAAQGIRFKDHDETTAGTLTLVPADINPGDNEVEIVDQPDSKLIIGNSIPPHLVGAFPNDHNPNSIAEQELALSIPASPGIAEAITPLEIGWNFGVSVHGIHFDPIAAEFWAGDPDSGWNYYPLGGAIELGVDANLAHVQPTGAYHYHGIPFGLMELVRYSEDAHSPLVGYAADGFPIYALTGVVDGKRQQMNSSYRLKAGERPGGDEPDGAYDGTFHADYEFIAGAGNLDECNGTMTVSAEYPGGTYAYFLTTGYPVVPMCWKGTPDGSFSNRPDR